jgi:hypothetical protein
MQFLLLFSLTTFLSLFQFDGWRGDIETPQAKQEALCADVQLSAKVFLEGPYVYNSVTSVGQMTASLSAVSPVLIPLTQPYTNAPYSFTYVINGVAQSAGYINVDESTTNAILTANAGTPNAIVDWVWLELWSDPVATSAPSVLVETHAALLQADGDVVDARDAGPVRIARNTSVECTGKSFYIAIKHRNHLGVKGTTLIGVNSMTPTVVADFTTTTGVALTTTAPIVDPRKTITLSGGISGRALYSGDTNNDNVIDAADRSNTWNDRNKTGTYPLIKNDCSMDGTVEATDRSITWNNRNKTNL